MVIVSIFRQSVQFDRPADDLVRYPRTLQEGVKTEQTQVDCNLCASR